MDIDSMDEIISLGFKDLSKSMIIKGKRTKRPRPPSPASAVFTASSCSSGGDGGSAVRGRGEKMFTNKIRSSESLCSDISTTTEEDEDMANCLILLAQSGHQNSINTSINITRNIEKQECATDSPSIKCDKNSARKLKEITITTSSTIVGKASVYVYECKTCNRSFPSFQALGGHRTSHKKIKPTVEMEVKRGLKFSQPDDHHHHHHGKEKQNKFLKISPSTLLSLETSKKNQHGKVHECSICGAEFSSGQALGGHMRRHRIPTSATTSATELSHDDSGIRPKNILALDLNLPAQPEDDHHDSKFELSLFSSPALVDCP